VSFLFARRCVQRRGAIPGGESVAVAEAVDVADVGEQSGGVGRSAAWQLEQRRTTRTDEVGEFLLQRFDLAIDRLELADQLDRQSAARRAR
jgi:hypothetical protein